MNGHVHHSSILRGYQLNGVAEIRTIFTRCRRVVFVLPTGGGKTVVFAYVTANAAAKNNRVIVLPTDRRSSIRSAPH